MIGSHKGTEQAVDCVTLPQSPRLVVCLGQHGACDTSAVGPDALQGAGWGLWTNESLPMALNNPGTAPRGERCQVAPGRRYFS